MKSIQQEVCAPSRPGFELLVQDVDVSLGGCQILHKINCFVRSGELLAVMGPSGAGKSTLLNAISGRLQSTSGDVLLDGQPISKALRRKIGYVEQRDIFFPNLTLRQTLEYTATLTLSDSTSSSHKAKRTDDVVRMLGLGDCLDTVMGGDGVTGLSGGERKRASIACEMLRQPSLLLVDEPTSGLDVVTASIIMKELKNCTVTTGQTVIATIHQPSSQVFHSFDRVLLLSEGQAAYFGEATKLLDFYADVGGYRCGPSYNPADFALEKLKLEENAHDKLVRATESRRDTAEWHDVLQLHQTLGQSPRNGKTPAHVEQDNEGFALEVTIETTDPETESVKKDGCSRQRALFRDTVNVPKWQTGSWTQLRTLVKRSLIEARVRQLSAVQCTFSIVMALFSGAIWFQFPRTEQTAVDRMGVIFFGLGFLVFLGALDPVLSIPSERQIVLKERTVGMYRLSSYCLSKIISDLPLLMVHTVVFVTIYYWMVGLDASFVNFLGHTLVMLLGLLPYYTLGTFIAVSTERLDVTLTTITIALLSSLLTAGFYLKHYPSWLGWIRYLSLAYYGYSAALEIEFRYGQHFDCAQLNKTIYPECLTNTTHVISGATILDETLPSSPLWVDIVALFGYTLLFEALAYIVLRYIKNPVHLS